MRSRPVLSVLAVIFALLTIFFVASIFLLGPTQNYTDVSREYTYNADSPDALPEDAPQEIEEDGKTYTLVPFDEIEKPDITVVEEEKHYSETVTLNDLPSKQAPETKAFTIGGKEYTLFLESADYTPIEKEYHATGQLTYQQSSQPNAPETTDVTYENEDGEVVTVPGKLTNIEKSGSGDVIWKNFRSTIRLPSGSNAFIVNGTKVVTYDPETPCWDGYEEDVLAGLGLEGKGYTVTSGKWDGDTYIDNGEVCRDIVWTLKAGTVPTWIAHYEAVGKNVTYNAVAVYSGDIKELNIPDQYATEENYTLSTNLTYRINEVISNNPIVKLMSSNSLLFPVLAGICGLLFVICVFSLVFLARTPSDRLNHADVMNGEVDYPTSPGPMYRQEYTDDVSDLDSLFDDRDDEDDDFSTHL